MSNLGIQCSMGIGYKSCREIYRQYSLKLVLGKTSLHLVLVYQIIQEWYYMGS